MRRTLDQLRTTLTWFTQQREDLALVLDTTDDEVAYVLKVFDGVEQQCPSDVFLLFGHEATDAHSYVASMMTSVRVQLDAVAAIRKQEGLSPWGDLPAACDDGRRSPSDRIKALVQYVHAQLPKGGSSGDPGVAAAEAERS